ncbi:Uncharacterised protein [Streptococcus anginosus]|nr:Uncharacterised protein [Streptococcus anginosus]
MRSTELSTSKEENKIDIAKKLILSSHFQPLLRYKNNIL